MSVRDRLIAYLEGRAQRLEADLRVHAPDRVGDTTTPFVQAAISTAQANTVEIEIVREFVDYLFGPDVEEDLRAAARAELIVLRARIEELEELVEEWRSVAQHHIEGTD